MFNKFCQSWHLEFLHILACLFNSSYIVSWVWMKSWFACREIIHVWQILQELWLLTLRNFTKFCLSSQLLLPYMYMHCFMDLNETCQECCSTCLLKCACGEITHVQQVLQELWILTEFLHILACLLNFLYNCCMDLNETRQECCTTSLNLHVWR